tara:strand:- start:3241 stop:3720 length:480 start_codon:yes stop_codon:yes gene_type:complete
VENGACRLINRKSRHCKRFRRLSNRIPDSIRAESAILDGEVVCLDDTGQAQFEDLMQNLRPPVYAVFDLVHLNGRDPRDEPMVERKRLLEEILADDPTPLLFVRHLEGQATALYQSICEMDGEGIVLKPKQSPYRQIKGRTSLLKVKNLDYTQAEDRGD